ncbi:DEAD/DEAH box helicase [Parvularcula dongshanensis]|uniref:ATP-dependent RNA helicase DeaD n=1 Tax=Parvularcula dongshanensis TaxID=1173995 RepID=A0A840HZG8_9PROT|nr:DEAD/DEAH box helicase [Parvularcula dongshanensis]MBB4657817.1 ATP-dependent RNA helicase DeaD [Parvularcula dongshanensis]
MTEPAQGLPPALSNALDAKGYDTLTDVQEAMLAPEVAGRDLLVSAQTGSGKTVAFGLAVGPDLLRGADRLHAAGPPLALAVAPTRELALQVARELTWLYREAGAVIATCVGGMDMRDERRALAGGAHIVVGTPGRLVDHVSRGSLDLSALRAVVLDEADEMLDLGFREELEAILEACPEERRTLMFSATVGGGIAKLASRYQNDALRISASGPSRQHTDIAYRALVTAQHDAERAIINTLRYYEAPNAIVFCSTRAAVARLSSRLGNRGFSVVSLSGELDQKARTAALQAMRDGRARVCVATDVAARGIDLPGLELVIHADLPKNQEGLLHRSGRTGRAGRKGTSVLIVPPRARRRVERLLGDAKVTAEWGTPPSAEEVEAKDDERLLADPALTEAPTEVTDLVRKIADEYSAEHLAAALVRLHRAGRSAPEELSEVEPLDAPRERKPRKEIEDAVWVVLSVGRTKRAEPRWLLPMLCKSGPMSKTAIGAIRVREDETYVQLDAEGASDFLERIGKAGRLEDGINVRRADGPPPPEQYVPRGPAQRRPEKPHPKTGTRSKPPYEKKAKPEPKVQPDGEPTSVAKPWSADADAPGFKRKPKQAGKTAGQKKVRTAADGAGPRKRPGKAKPFKRVKSRPE